MWQMLATLLNVVLEGSQLRKKEVEDSAHSRKKIKSSQDSTENCSKQSKG